MRSFQRTRRARNRVPKVIATPILALVVLALLGTPPASADTGITVYPPQVVNVAGFGVAVTATVTSHYVGATECPDGGDVCEGRHIRIAIYQSVPGLFVPIVFAPSPDPVTKSATVGTKCVNRIRYRGEFFQQIVWILQNPAPLPPAQFTRDDLRWGTELYANTCLGNVTPPTP